MDKSDILIGMHLGRLDLLMRFKNLLMWGAEVDFLLFVTPFGEILH